MMSIKPVGLVRNYILLTTGELASKIVTFAAMAFLSRIAGPDGYGNIEFAAAVLLCAGLIVDQGFSIYGAREIAKDRKSTNYLTSEIVFVRFILAIGAYLLLIGFAYLLDRSQFVTMILLIYGLSLLGMPLLMNWVFQGHNRMGYAAMISVIRQFVFAAVVFGFIREPEQIWIAGVGEVAGVFCAAIFGTLVVNRFYRWRLFSRPHVTRSLFTDGIPIGLSQMFWMIRMFGATVIIGVIGIPADVGYFGSAMRILIASHAFVYLYYFNLLPSMSQAWQRQDRSFQSLINHSFHLVAWIGVLVGIVWIILAPFVMTIIYGPAFSEGGLGLQIMAGVFVIAALDGHYRYGLVAAGFQNLEMMTALIGALITILLIPLGYTRAGVEGSALGLLAAECLVWLSTWVISRRKLELKNHAALLTRPILGAIISGLIVWWLPLESPIGQASLAAFLVILTAFLLDPSVRNLARRLFSTWRLRLSV